MTSREFPGFVLPGTPRFNGARATSMFAGDPMDPVSVLDLAMVFGSRLWGHDEATVGLDDLGAPGAGDLYTHAWRANATELATLMLAAELGEDADAWRALILHTGSEAVETALKTALRATGRTKMVAFEGGYHGTFGLALAVTHNPAFREPWAAQYAADTVRWAAWGTVPTLDEDVACVIVEPWLGRAGVIPPPAGFHAALRAECDRVGAVLILDAVLCGSGRTGPVIAECLTESRPDVVCLGKAIGSGVTASVVLARTALATAAWDRGAVEPAHTSTSLGDPIASAAIVRSISNLRQRSRLLDEHCRAWRAIATGIEFGTKLKVRGVGLLWAFDTRKPGLGLQLAERLLHEHRILVVPSGPKATGITIYPAAAHDEGERERFAVAITSIFT
ncbi:MAG: Acetylornithine aminotransferase [Thermoleophilia bacterium]|nr:Acetylornithine aminotransferase [Thermoleophilia bacterium]